MKNPKDVHLANNMLALNLIAQNKVNVASSYKKPDRLLEIARNLYVSSQKDPFDEEMTYVLLFRFIHVCDQLVLAYNDQRFVAALLDKELRNAKAQINELKNSLISRYEVNEARKVAESLPMVVEVRQSSRVFEGLFITCAELFKASKRELNLLVLDARPCDDFKQSSIKGFTCINIPDSCIQSGLSAHKLGGVLPRASLEDWEKREKFDVLVLLDWCTCRTNYAMSKLEKLRTILVDWDFNRSYREEPVVLSGGYGEWVDMYPTFCTNPNVKYVNSNADLDDLLNLDVIEYPTDEESKSHEIFKQEIARAVVESSKVENVVEQTRGELLEEERVLTVKNNEIEKDLLDSELKWKSVQAEIDKEKDVGKLESLRQAKQRLEETIGKLTEEEDAVLAKKCKLADEFNLSSSFKPGETEQDDAPRKLKDINKLHEQNLDMYKARQACMLERQRLLDEARSLKKTLEPQPKPTINRAVKPVQTRHLDGVLQSIKHGLTGLTNIKNTCYMNAILQCLRHLPEIAELYCNANYTKHITRNPPVVSNEFAHLTRALWCNTYSIIRPTEFYKKITGLSPAYKAGYHEDCMEFFLQLFNYLSDDCALDIAAKTNWNETQIAWHQQHSGKISVYADMFYHQIRVQRVCAGCRYSSLKFEIDNVFYLPIPETTFSLETCLNAYLTNAETIPCKKCKASNVAVNKTFAHHPQILVVSLKRHMQDFVANGLVHYKKNQSQCNFPLDNFRVGKCSYKLWGVALHVGTMQSGHYTAACLNPTNNKWYLFNDEEVTQVDVGDSSIRMKAYAFFYSMKRDMRAG